jgi:hypothetical protein
MDDSNSFMQNPLRRFSHFLYSPSISPSDFDLFGQVKSAVIGREVPDEIGLLEAVIEIFNGISSAELQWAFLSGIKRVERVIDAGNCLTSPIFRSSVSHSRSTRLCRISSFIGHLNLLRLYNTIFWPRSSVLTPQFSAQISHFSSYICTNQISCIQLRPHVRTMSEIPLFSASRSHHTSR